MHTLVHRALPKNGTDPMTVAVFVAVIAHAIVVLGVSFEREHPPLQSLNSLDIVLVQSRTEEAPEDAEQLAQANSDGGGGEAERPERAATPIPTPLAGMTPEIVASSPPAQPAPVAPADPPAPERVEVTDPEPEPVLSQREVATADTVAATGFPRPQPRPQRLRNVEPPAVPPVPQTETLPDLNATRLVSRSLAMASLSAEVDRKLNAYTMRPKRKWISARTREIKYASYMEAWRAKVERIGNMNYPDEARRAQMSGKLVLDVAIRPDGSLQSVNIRSSSGKKVLDDAATRIVRLAAPYAAFPESFRDEVDVLHIERTWRFLSSNRLAAR